jgi:hypothetical protein
MFHPGSDVCGESIQDVEGNLGEACNIDVIGLQKSKSGTKKWLKGDLSRRCNSFKML